MNQDDSNQPSSDLSKTVAWSSISHSPQIVEDPLDSTYVDTSGPALQTAQMSEDEVNRILALQSSNELQSKAEDRDLIDQRYRLLSLIGEGGCGVIYRAEDIKISDRPVALKLLNFDLTKDAKINSLFERERKVLSRMSHPSILTLYDSGTTDKGQPYFVTELLNGRDLEEDLYSRTYIDLDEIIQILMSVAGALSEAHSLGVIHRDIKPANIYLHFGSQRSPRNYQVKVLDFGIAKIKSGMLKTIASMQHTTDVILGTPYYMSPEQHLNAGEVDHRTDIYAFGILFYQLITGELPFLGQDYMEVATKHIKSPMPSLKDRFEPNLGLQIDILIGKLTAKKAQDRFQNMDEVYDELTSLHQQLTGGQILPNSTNPFLMANPHNYKTKIIETDPENQVIPSKNEPQDLHTVGDEERNVSGRYGLGVSNDTFFSTKRIDSAYQELSIKKAQRLRLIVVASVVFFSILFAVYLYSQK